MKNITNLDVCNKNSFLTIKSHLTDREIPEGWKIGKVGDLVNVRAGYAIKSSDFCKSGVGVIKIKNIDSKRVDLIETNRVTPEFFEALPDEYKVSCGDVLIAMTGATIGKTGKIRSTKESFALNQRVARFVANDKWDLEYIFHFTLSREFINSIHNLATGAAQQNISAENISAIPMLIPPKEERTCIAKILSDLDEKIELNRQMNKTLETIAQAIFKRWFVDFEFPFDFAQGKPDLNGQPYKSSGGKMIASDLGRIPEKWRIAQLGDCLDILETGQRPKGGVSDIQEGIPSVGAENIIGIGQYSFGKEKFVGYNFFNNMKRGIVLSEDVLLYKDGGKPGEFKPRVSMFGHGFPYDKFAINEHVFRLRSNYLGQSFLYFQISHENVLFELKHKGGKAAIPGINQNEVRTVLIIIPPSDLLRLFDQFTGPMLRTILKTAKQSISLSKIRDSLLPKLISGKIRVEIS